MGSREIVCLANSRKYNGKCIAGKDPSDHLWVRPVSSSGKGELKTIQIKFEDGTIPKLLDIISLPLKKYDPKTYQPENWLISSERWRKVGTYPDNKLDELCDDVPILWINNQPSKDRISHKYIKKKALGSSLLFIRVKDAVILREDKEYEDKEKKKVKAYFSYNQIHYTLSVTDPEIEKRYGDKKPGKYPISADRVYMCISLGEPYEADDCCYKLVASIITTDFAEDMTVETNINNVELTQEPKQLGNKELVSPDRKLSSKRMESRNKNSILMAIIQTMGNINFKFGRSFLKDILKGSKSKRILEVKNLATPESYGLLSDYTGEQILAIIDELISDGYLEINNNFESGFRRPLIFLTEESKKSLAHEKLNEPRGDSSHQKSYTVENIRETHPKAYEKWTEEEEKTLTKLFKKGTTIEDISNQCGRKPGAIRSRLKKLGLTSANKNAET
ncbi:MAG: RQC domain-containing protein [Thermoplasmata archaeon]|nr:RQC domain-containing protein [Thermoplasmata archaeon]